MGVVSIGTRTIAPGLRAPREINHVQSAPAQHPQLQQRFVPFAAHVASAGASRHGTAVRAGRAPWRGGRVRSVLSVPRDTRASSRRVVRTFGAVQCVTLTVPWTHSHHRYTKNVCAPVEISRQEVGRVPARGVLGVGPPPRPRSPRRPCRRCTPQRLRSMPRSRTSARGSARPGV